MSHHVKKILHQIRFSRLVEVARVSRQIIELNQWTHTHPANILDEHEMLNELTIKSFNSYSK